MRNTYKIVLGLIFMLFSTGCSTTSTATLNVIKYPDFFPDNQSYKTMVMANTVNQVSSTIYVYDINHYIFNALNENAYYHVISGIELEDQKLLTILQKAPKGDLIIFHTITDYLTEYDPGYIFNVETYADVHVIVIEAKTSNTIYSNTVRGTCTQNTTDVSEVSSSYQAQMCAIKNAILNEIPLIAPVPVSLTVHPDDVLKITHKNAETRGKESLEFEPTETLIASLAFPGQALHNTFKFDIAYGEHDEVIFSEEIKWESQENVFEFNLSDLLQTAEGAHAFKLRIWNGDSVAIEKTVTVK